MKGCSGTVSFNPDSLGSRPDTFHGGENEALETHRAIKSRTHTLTYLDQTQAPGHTATLRISPQG